MFLKMNISGSILIILIILLRFFAINKLPKKVFVLLWNIVILRLMIPFDLPIHYGIASPMTKIVDDGVRYYNIANNPVIIKNPEKPIANTAKLLDKAAWTTFVWAAGTLVLLVVFFVLYWREYQKIRTALPVSKEIDNYFRSVVTIPHHVKLLISDRIFTPLTFGILSPKIIFPKILEPLEDMEIKYVLTHEMIHIKRFDNLWKIIMLIVMGTHWFNPLVWIMYILFNRDIELSCDEKVIALLGETAKKGYIMSLVNLAEKQHHWSLISNGFGKNAIQERIAALMKFKKATYISIGCAAFLLAGAITVFAQNDSKEISNDVNMTAEFRSMDGSEKERENKLLGNFDGYNPDEQKKTRHIGESMRITKEELSNEIREVINSCDDEKWYVINDTNYQYVYFNHLPADYMYQPEIYVGSHSGTINIFDVGTSTGNYVLLEIDRNVFLEIFYNHSQVTYTELSI